MQKINSTGRFDNFMNLQSFHWRRLALALAVVSCFFAVGLSRVDIETDIVGFLPKGDPVISDALYIFKNHPIQDQLVIDISLQKENLELLVDCAKRVENNLRQSNLFEKVGLQDFQSLLPDLVFHILNHLPLLFSTEELQNQIQPLLEPLKIRKKMAETQESLFNLEGIGQTEFISRDPLGFKDIVMGRLAPLVPTQSANIYKGQLISKDGQHLLVIADSAASSTDTAFARRLSELIDTITKNLNRRYEKSGNRVTLTPMGAYRIALDNELIVRKDVRNAILFATLGIILLLIFSFPRPYLGLLSLLPAIAGAMTAFFVFALIHDSVSLMVLGFGGAIISISVDHGIAYLLFLDRPHLTYGKDASQEVRAIGLVAALTTIGAFAALNFSGFPILEQLGQFTALGISFSFIFVHTVFPLIFPAMPAARSTRMPLQQTVNKMARTGKKGAYAALLFALVMFIFAKPQFNVSLNSMNTVSMDTKAAEDMIAKVWDMKFNKIYLMTESETLDGLQLKGDRLAKMIARERRSGSLSSSFVSSMVFPGAARQQQNFAAWRKFWDYKRIKELKASLTAESLKFGFTADAFEPFFEMLQVSTYDPETMIIPEKFFGLMGITADPTKRAWLQINTLTTEKGYSAEEFHAKYSKLGRLFDPNFFSQELGRQLFATFTKMLVIVVLSVTVLVFFYFVDLTLTFISLLPVIFALISTLGTLKLIGHPLDIPGLMLAIIVFGMGIDYSLFFVRSYQRYGDPFHPYFGLVRMTVFLAGASTLIGFGVLSAARHSLLRSAGITSLFGIGYSLIGAFVILPPLLAYRLRTRQADKPKQGRIEDRVLWRYKNLEAYPRLFARFKMQFDPMFSELPRLLDSYKGISNIMDIGCGYGVPAAWLLERFPGASITGVDPDVGRIRVASRVIGKNGTVKTGSAPDIPVVSQPVNLAMMLDIVHFLSDDELKLTFKQLYDCINPGDHLILRAAVPPTRRMPWAWWLENVKLKLNQIRPRYRSPQNIKAMLVQSDFEVEQMLPSGTKGELVWFIASKKLPDEKN
jgi:predicted exporter/trans-aconitate methyltransferase